VYSRKESVPSGVSGHAECASYTQKEIAFFISLQPGYGLMGTRIPLNNHKKQLH
jgi:hypothetical protein